ncbi:MAG: hypothetical protein AB7F41_04875 [Methylocystis sp.]|uniref:hypothetical protein n=1 Tax=Methylocystis sp. TaxID=1911079 RepID=UPI003D110B25
MSDQDLAIAGQDATIAHWSADDDIARAVAVYAHARHEADQAHARCVNTTKILGPRIWREGHPLDREKLRQRRVWRYRTRVCFQHLTQALRDWRPTGGGH